MEPVRQMLHVPANPCGQRTLLIVLIHGCKVAPLWISTHDLRDAGLEVDAKPLPEQQEQTRAARPRCGAHARPKSRRSKKESNESSFKQHPVRLMTGKILRSADERQEAHKRDCEHSARPHIGSQ